MQILEDHIYSNKMEILSKNTTIMWERKPVSIICSHIVLRDPFLHDFLLLLPSLPSLHISLGKYPTSLPCTAVPDFSCALLADFSSLLKPGHNDGLRLKTQETNGLLMVSVS